MVSVVFGCEGQRIFAETALKASLNMESKMYGLHKENQWFLVSSGARDNAHLQIGLEVGLNMESKMYGFRKENLWFLVSLGARNNAFSQN